MPEDLQREAPQRAWRSEVSRGAEVGNSSSVRSLLRRSPRPNESFGLGPPVSTLDHPGSICDTSPSMLKSVGSLPNPQSTVVRWAGS